MDDESRPSAGDTENIPAPDRSHLKSPLMLGKTGLKQLLQCYQVGTDEIRQTMLHECDVIIECKVCRSLYRGLPNFLAHKRSYCTENYSDTLVRFQEMPTKEDESCMFGSAIFRGEENDKADDDDEFQFGRKSRRRKQSGEDAAYSQVYNFFKNIHKVNQNVSKVRSTDQIVQLDVLDETSNAVTQTVTSTSDVIKDNKDVILKKRKRDSAGHNDDDSGGHSKMALLESPDDNLASDLNGVKSNRYHKVSSLRQFFVHLNLCSASSSTNECLKCKMEFSTYKTLKLHMKRRHIKRKQFIQCLECPKLYTQRDVFVRHLMDDHSLSKSVATGQITSSNQIGKIVVDGQTVYDPFSLTTKPSGPATSTPQGTSQNRSHLNDSTRSQMNESTRSQLNDSMGVDDMDDTFEAAGSEREEDAGSDDGGKRGGYLCTKTFWLAIVRCLGLHEDGFVGSKRLYRCLKHPALTFKKYTDFKDHILHEHIAATIYCPICKQSFHKPVHKTFTNLAAHLKASHNITESSVMRLKHSLPRHVLKGEIPSDMNSDPDEGDDGNDGGQDHDTHDTSTHDTEEVMEGVDTEATGLDEQTLVPEAPSDDRPTVKSSAVEDKGTKLYQCVRCDKTALSYWNLKTHLMNSHGLTSEECATLRQSLEENVIYKPRRQTNRRRAVCLEGGITSTFNLEDSYCPLCHRGYPKIGQVIAHLMSNHGCDRDEANAYRSQLKESYLKQQERNVQSLSGGYNRQRRSPKSEDTAQNKENNDDNKGKRKQSSPYKADTSPYKADTSQEMKASATKHTTTSSPAAKITFSSGFSLYSCPKCHRVFGQKALLALHQIACPADRDRRTEVNDQSSESSSDESSIKTKRDDSTSSMAEVFKKRLPGMQCSKCKRNFHKKIQRQCHERLCSFGAENADSEAGFSSDDSRSKSKTRTRKVIGTDVNKNCDKDSAGTNVDTEVLYKVYKCPLCDFEDLELHKISHHLVTVHEWSSSKVAARRDTLKRSIVFRSCPDVHQSQDSGDHEALESNLTESLEQETDVTELSQPEEASQDDSTTDVLPSQSKMTESISPSRLSEFSCHLCPRVYPEQYKLCYHWQMAHGLDADVIARLKKDLQERQRKLMINLHHLPRSSRRTAVNDTKTNGNAKTAVHASNTTKESSTTNGAKTGSEANQITVKNSQSSPQLIELAPMPMADSDKVIITDSVTDDNQKINQQSLNRGRDLIDAIDQS